MKRIVMHIDVNNAFLSWEALYMLKNGSKVDIREIPAIIGGDPKKRAGIVLAKSILAKQYGIVSAESIYSAKTKCPDLKIYQPHYQIYQEYSNKLFNLIREYTDEIEIISVDECFLEYTSIMNTYKDPLLFAQMLQKRIYNELSFTVNIGIANNKLCAKMASDFQKPNKIHTLYKNEIEAKLWPLPVGDLYMVGKSSEEILSNLNIKTIKDLAKADINLLKKYFKTRANLLKEYANGIDDSLINVFDEVKSIGNECTLATDLENVNDILSVLKDLSVKVSKRLKEKRVYTTNVAIVLKDNKFNVISHQKRLKNPINTGKELFEVAKELLFSTYADGKIRLIGLRTNNLVLEKSKQLSLFDDDINDEKIDKVIDEINSRYQKQVINYTDIYK